MPSDLRPKPHYSNLYKYNQNVIRWLNRIEPNQKAITKQTNEMFFGYGEIYFPIS